MKYTCDWRPLRTCANTNDFNGACDEPSRDFRVLPYLQKRQICVSYLIINLFVDMLIVQLLSF